jgi:hypothetical protein
MSIYKYLWLVTIYVNDQWWLLTWLRFIIDYFCWLIKTDDWWYGKRESYNNLCVQMGDEREYKKFSTRVLWVKMAESVGFKILRFGKDGFVIWNTFVVYGKIWQERWREEGRWYLASSMVKLLGLQLEDLSLCDTKLAFEMGSYIISILRSIIL